MSKNMAVVDDFSQEFEDVPPSINTNSEDGKGQELTTQQTMSLSHEVKHEVAIPDLYPYVPLGEHIPPKEAARTYSFTLDPFQQLSVACIERNESVLVSAHTSAGKTVVAEYAIAKALKDRQRVIYTSPIKALSNQKYREMCEIFDGDVGLMTGDVTINSTASCLVMTTEILRSMLYRGSEVMREVSWVIFDEIHYMRDKERGVVWEETLILLPDSVRFVFLSATIPNAKQFARWICDLHRQPCHVIYTSYRPTPLQHYLFPTGADGIFLAVDEKGCFREDNFQRALAVFGANGGDGDSGESVLGAKTAPPKRIRPQSNGTGQQSDISKIITMIMSKGLTPAIVFSFSKKECEKLAMQVSRLEFNGPEERKLVADVFSNAMESLSEEDRLLPQIESILPLLKNGIGIHHSGLLPILKEVIEILFQEGLLKLLFATETFSIGLNMPARTVVFTSARKFDGKDFRWISGGEYIQMSGRAGRRGLDARGIVILMIEEKMDPSVAKGMLKGQSDYLNSAFHLSYNMILNLMRVEGVLSPEELLSKSFFQFQSADQIPKLQEELSNLTAKRDSIQIDGEADISRYWEVKKQLSMVGEEIRRVVHHHSNCISFIQPGRLAHIKISADFGDDEIDFGWCPIVSVKKKTISNGGVSSRQRGGAINENITNASFIIDVLAFCDKGDIIRPAISESEGEMKVIPVSLNIFHGLSSVRIYLPKDLKDWEQRQTVYGVLNEVKKRFPNGPPLLDAKKDQGIKEGGFLGLLKKSEALQQSLELHPINRDPSLLQKWSLYKEKRIIYDSISLLEERVKATQAIVHADELVARRRLLRKLGFITETDVICLKGRVACEISTGDEMLLTELMFSGHFIELSPEQIVALLSTFVFQEKSEEIPKLREELATPLRVLHEAARRVARQSAECNVSLSSSGSPLSGEEEYVQSFRPELMEVVYSWCQGMKFIKICKMTEVYEGSIIRCMRRLEELLRQMAQAAHSIGNDVLESKFNSGISMLKRDIVFSNSLYL